MELKDKLEEIRSIYGHWTAHNIRIAKNLYTISPGPPDRAQQRAYLYSALYRTLSKKRLYRKKILDLGCLEGSISISLAREGALCTGVDVRPNHLTKASFAARALGLQRRCRWVQADITDPNFWRNIGRFDIIVCSGILYHIDSIDLLPLLKHMRAACNSSSITFIDTNIAPLAQDCVEVPGLIKLWGCHWKEHEPEAGSKERLAESWSAFSNNNAFWLTERSLVNALVCAGFGTVIKPLYPYHEWGHQTRDVWIAMCGESLINDLPFRSDPDTRPWAHPSLA